MIEEYNAVAREKKQFSKGELKTIYENMLAKGFDLEMVIQITGLTPAEIENLTDEDFDDD